MPYEVRVTAETAHRTNELHRMYPVQAQGQTEGLASAVAMRGASPSQAVNQGQGIYRGVVRSYADAVTYTKPCPGTALGLPCFLPDGHAGDHAPKLEAGWLKPDPNGGCTITAADWRAQFSQEQQRANKLGDECGRLATELKDERARCRELERKIERMEARR